MANSNLSCLVVAMTLALVSLVDGQRRQPQQPGVTFAEDKVDRHYYLASSLELNQRQLAQDRIYLINNQFRYYDPRDEQWYSMPVKRVTRDQMDRVLQSPREPGHQLFWVDDQIYYNPRDRELYRLFPEAQAVDHSSGSLETQDIEIRGTKRPSSQRRPATTTTTTTESPRDQRPTTVATEEPEVIDVRLITKPMLKLALHFLRCHGTNDCTSNSVLSPLSITSVLTLLMTGSDGMTYSQLKALNYAHNSSDSRINSAYKSLMHDIEKLAKSGKSAVQLRVANGIFAPSSPLESFLEKAGEFYSSQMIKLKPPSSQWTAVLNDWVSDKTNKRIQKIVEEVPADTLMVVANAVYFKGDWAEPFGNEFTYNGTFRVSPTEILQGVPKMVGSYELLYADDSDLGCQIIALPYEGDKVFMYLILPTDDQGIDSLNQLQSKLDPQVIYDLMDKMVTKTVSIEMPKFRIEQLLSLKESLQSLGVVDLFQSGKADLSRLTDIRQTAVDDIVHKTFIQVDEAGTEAAGVTGVFFTRVSSSKTFNATQPFLYFIMDSDDAVYFSGRVVRPTSAGDR